MIPNIQTFLWFFPAVALPTFTLAIKFLTRKFQLNRIYLPVFRFMLTGALGPADWMMVAFAVYVSPLWNASRVVMSTGTLVFGNRPGDVDVVRKHHSSRGRPASGESTQHVLSELGLIFLVNIRWSRCIPSLRT